MARSGLILPSTEARIRRPQPLRPASRLSRRVPVPTTGGRRIRLDGGGPPRKHRRPRHERRLVQDLPGSPKGWLIAVIVLSLLAHVLIVLAFVVVGRHMPKWSEPVKIEKPPEVALVLAPPPPPAAKPEFFPTQPQANAPHKAAPFISDNDAALQSRNQQARKPNSPLPDVTGQPDHSFDLQSTPPALKFDRNPTPPAEQPNQKSEAKPNDATKPAPPDPSAIRPTDNPQRSHETAVKAKPIDQQFDPNGLPVLPALNEPTLAPQTPQTQPIPSPRKPTPASKQSFAVTQSDVQGVVGQPGDNSPAAMATDLGRYKAKVYRAVGARWYEKVASQLQVLGVGTVHINFTIYSDGHMVITADPDASNQSLMLLHSISLNSMTESAPFDAFSPAMKKEVGDSYSDDFSFSIYGN